MSKRKTVKDRSTKTTTNQFFCRKCGQLVRFGDVTHRCSHKAAK